MLSRDIRRYIDLRRSMGFKFRTPALLLKSFVKFAARHGDDFVLTARATEWARQAPSAYQRHNRLATLRRCAIALHAENPRHEVPPERVFGHQTPKRRIPHLYAPQEIARLIEGARQLPPRGSIRPLTYATLLGLLAATGMRVSEALALQVSDLTADGLVIRTTKFKKSRLVALHRSTRKALDRYLAVRKGLSCRDPALFVSPAGRRVSYSRTQQVFLSLARRLGLRAGPGVRGPRLHDLRHTFAVRSLEQCPPDRSSIARHMTGLSTYLGHAKVLDTYWYLRATPALLQQIARAGEALHRGVQP